MHSHAKLGNIKQHSCELLFVVSVGTTLGRWLPKLSDVAIASLCRSTSPNTMWYGALLCEHYNSASCFPSWSSHSARAPWVAASESCVRDFANETSQSSVNA